MNKVKKLQFPSVWSWGSVEIVLRHFGMGLQSSVPEIPAGPSHPSLLPSSLWRRQGLQPATARPLQPCPPPSCAAVAVTLQLREDVSTGAGRPDKPPSQAAMPGPTADSCTASSQKPEPRCTGIYPAFIHKRCFKLERCQAFCAQAGALFNQQRFKDVADCGIISPRCKFVPGQLTRPEAHLARHAG